MSPSHPSAHPLLRSQAIVALIAFLALVLTGVSVSQAHAAEAPPAGTYTGSHVDDDGNGELVSFSINDQGIISDVSTTSYCYGGGTLTPVPWADMPATEIVAGQPFIIEWDVDDLQFSFTGTVNADGTASGTGVVGMTWGGVVICGGSEFSWNASTEVNDPDPDPVYDPTASVNRDTVTEAELADPGIVIEGADFPSSAEVDLLINGSPQATADALYNGNVVFDYSSTTLGTGTHEVLLQSGDLSATTSFTVEADAPVYDPEVSVSPQTLTESEVAESGVSVSLSGFPAEVSVDVTLGGSQGESVVTDTDGAATLSNYVSSAFGVGTHNVVASYEDLEATTTFTVVEDEEPEYNPQISVTPSTLPLSEALDDGFEVSITGFPAQTLISVGVEETQSGETIMTDDDGSVFYESFTVGGLGPDDYTIVATADGLRAEATVTVTEDDDEDPVYDPTVSVDPSSVTQAELADGGVTITGSDFPASANVVLTVGGIVTESADADASGVVAFDYVSSDLAVGQHSVVLSSAGLSATSTLTVTADEVDPVYDPTVSLSSTQVTVSEIEDPGVTISGSGFPENATVTLAIGGDDAGTEASDDAGNVEFAYTSDSIAVGDHTVSLSAQGEGASAWATLTVIADPVVTEPAAEVTPSTVTQSDLATTGVTVTGVNFPADEPVHLTVDGVDAGSQTADADGTVAMSYTSDTLAPGTYTALLVNGDQWAEASFTVEADSDPVYDPEISLSTTEVTESVLANDGVDVTGTGFPANAPVTLSVADSDVTTANSNADGVVVFTFWGENIGPGEYTVRLEADAQGAQAETTITVTADQAPTPGTIPAVEPNPEDLDPAREGDIEVPAQAQPGDTIVLTVTGVEPGTEVGVWIFSDPTYLGTFTVDANNQVTVTIPEAIPTGTHTISVWTDEGLVGWETIVLSAADDDAGPGATDAAGGTEDELAVTGGTLAVGTVIGGLFLLVIGFGLVLLARTRGQAAA